MPQLLTGDRHLTSSHPSLYQSDHLAPPLFLSFLYPSNRETYTSVVLGNLSVGFIASNPVARLQLSEQDAAKIQCFGSYTWGSSKGKV